MQLVPITLEQRIELSSSLLGKWIEGDSKDPIDWKKKNVTAVNKSGISHPILLRSSFC
jgi:hypothetical protein